MSQPMVFVFLPVHNRKEITLQFVQALKNQDYPSIKLVLIDDGSTDGTEEAVLSVLPETLVVKGDGNLWWAGSLQAGLQRLRTEKPESNSIILTINDDTLIKKDFVSIGVAHLTKNQRELFIARSYSQKTDALLDSGVEIDWFRFRFHPNPEPNKINCASTRGLFLRFSDFEVIGNFMPKVLPHYYSDYEFTVRAYRLGYRLHAPEDLKLWMNEETTGLHHSKEMGIRQYFKKSFTIRSAINPWTAVKFITVAAPWAMKPFCYFRIFIFFLKSVTKAAMNGI